MKRKIVSLLIMLSVVYGSCSLVFADEADGIIPEEGSAADEAGLQVGDVIIDVDGTAVKTGAELSKIKNEHKAGESMELTYVRSGEEKTVTVTLDEAVAEKE